MTDPAATDTTPAEDTEEVSDTALATLPADRLAAMVRDKRKAEASLRARLRDTEAERNRLAEQVTGQQWRDLDTAATKAGIRPEALADLHQHVKLEELTADDGAIDPGKLDAALTGLKSDRPHYFVSPGASTVDHAGGAGEPAPPYQASWSDVLNAR